MPEEIPGQMELPFDDETETLKAKLTALREQNTAHLKNLMAMQLQPEPTGLVMLRVNALIDFLLADEFTRLHFDLLFETRVGEALEAMLSEAQKAKLAMPTEQHGSGLFLPGMK